MPSSVSSFVTNTLKWRRSILIVVTLAMFCLSIAVNLPTAAARKMEPCFQYTEYHYSDAAHTNLCGWATFACDGRVHRWGCSTSYFETQVDMQCAVECPPM